MSLGCCFSMGRKHCARRWWRRGQHHSSTQVAAESVASAMSGPSFSLFSDSQSLFSPNPRSSHVENTTENVELDGGKGNNINASSVDETPYHSLPDTNSEPVIGGVPVTDKGKVIVQIRVMHHLLIREVHHEVKNEMRFVVNDSRLRFGLDEFAVVTGLKCKGDTSIESIAENRLISKYFGTASVTLAQLADCFMKQKWETYYDALKIAVLYFVNSFLLSQLKTKLKNITSTDDEKQLFDVHGLNFEIEVECTDSQPDSFQHKQQDDYPDFHDMHNDYDQFERGHVGNDPVVIGDSTPKAPSMSGFGGVGRDGGATGVNVKNVTASLGVVNDDLRSAKMLYIDADNAFMCSASRVDGVGQVDVGGSNVNFPSAPCQHGGDLHLDSDFEYTDSQLDLIAAITQGGRRNVKQSGNELTTRDVNKSKPDQSVSRSIVQTQTDVETIPTVFTRRRRPASVKQSPYRNDWQSGVSAVGGSSKVIKGRFPFVNDISVAVDYKLTTAFSNFVEANMQLGECVFVSIDCGVYVACFAKYIIEDLPIPVANFDVDGLRARFGILLWHYGRNKQLHGESSESEAPVAPKKTRGKKRKK
ncbi:hypothetical protein A4A49_21486 [Nicotiana attenuata]|uniref:DUF1985 domain-containing protein n=1 Tax=Nicotiana attenuata TaxID=49451 RepID=A0A314L532_NICAT|nr:hypothetical protein A4A49_21486 [Nicotiana attenuata]